MADLRAAQVEFDKTHPRAVEPISPPRSKAEQVAYEREMIAMGIGRLKMSGHGIAQPYSTDPRDWAAYHSAVARYEDSLIDRAIEDQRRLAEERSRPRSEQDLLDDAATTWLTNTIRFLPLSRGTVNEVVVPLLAKRARLVRAGAKRAAVLDVEIELDDLGCLPPCYRDAEQGT